MKSATFADTRYSCSALGRGIYRRWFDWLLRVGGFILVIIGVVAIVMGIVGCSATGIAQVVTDCGASISAREPCYSKRVLGVLLRLSTEFKSKMNRITSNAAPRRETRSRSAQEQLDACAT